MKGLAVLFPGIGYTVDKPLMHYSRRLAQSLGYEVKPIPYRIILPDTEDNQKRKELSLQAALEQSKEMLAGTDLAAYDQILFIGKSIGTRAAACLAAQIPQRNRIRFILYTPLEETFVYPFEDAIVFTGSKDPWVGEGRIAELCEERGIPCEIIPEANHSLETKDPIEDIQTLRNVLKKTENFIQGGMNHE